MVMEAMANRRLRLHFKDSSILTKTQKKLGLERSWLLLKPHHHTISDVVSNILDAFNLHQSCPHGILLTMDGFVLPPFESTIIFKDKDLVSVRRKRSGVKANIKAVTFNEDEIVEKQPLSSGVRLLANEKFNKGAGGYESETDADEVEAKEPVQSAGSGDVASRKRKASSPTEISKKKRLRQISPKCVQKDTDHCENIRSLRKKRNNAGVIKDEVTGTSINNSEQIYESNEFEKTKEVIVLASDAHDGARKVSRSTWRNMRKRQWRKVRRAINNEEGEKKCPLEDLGKVTKIVKNVNGNIEQLAEEDSDTDADDDLVPVVICPGHIRFSSASKAKNVQQVQEANVWDVKKNQENGWVQMYQEANGWDVRLTQNSVWDHSAQKNVWDSHNSEVAKPSRKGFRDYNGQSSNSRTIENQQSSSDNGRNARCWPTSDQPTSSCKQSEDHNTQSSDTRGFSRKLANDFSMDLEKLMPLIDSPQVGDIIAYRLLELSSSWCPELSSFRVGKITSFDHESNIIMLVPQAEYPLNLERKADNDHDDDDSGQPTQSSVYNEDGSLEIDFLSLVDVRIVRSANPSHSGDAEVPVVNGTPGSAGMSKNTDRVDNGSKDVPLDITGQELHTPTNLEDRKKDVWEEIREALSAKKAQLMQEDAWKKKESLTKCS